MKLFHKVKTMALLLPALILVSTASVRVTFAEQSGGHLQDETKMEPAAILQYACAKDGQTGMTAAYAAEAMRYETGLISVTSHDVGLTRGQLLQASFQAANRAVKCALDLDLAEWEQSLQPFDANVYDSYAQHAECFKQLAQRMNGAIQSASAECMRFLSRDLRSIGAVLYSGDQPSLHFSWQECAALYCAFGSDLDAVVAEADELTMQGGYLSGVTPLWADPAFEAVASGGTREQLFETKFALAYLKTVYDDEGNAVPAEVSTYPEEYLQTVAHPLPGGTIKDSWYAPRSHNTRLHMGTDIHAGAKTPILSATDGTVLYVGSMPIPGNFVIVRDAYGYEYHYYHMYELSTFVTEGQGVKQGQQIGRVGNTGNSDMYHLHVSVVSPDGKYLNPYDLFAQAGLGPLMTD
jgi:hypothetical protein